MNAAQFEVLYQDEFGAVWGFLHRLGLRPPALEDALHDVFLIAWRRRDDFDVTRAARPWLLGIAFRRSANLKALAHLHREVPMEDLSQASGHVGDADARLDAEALLSRALGAMTFEARSVFVLHELEERPIPEVAQLMGTPVGTAYTRLRAARQVLAVTVQATKQQEARHE